MKIVRRPRRVQHKTRHKRAAHAAKPAEDYDGERLVADDEANPWIDQVVQESDQPPATAASADPMAKLR